MALNIEGAQYGFDANKLQSTLNHVHNNCVVHTKNTLRRSMDTLRTALDSCWAGQSAETFKGNMQSDIDNICKDLDLAYEALKGVFQEVQNKYAELDEGLVTAR